MKKIRFFLSLIFILIIFVMPLAGCSFIDSIFGYSPKIVAYGNVIQWAAVNKAVSYEIYVDNEHYASTTDLYYIFDDLPKDSNITVKAKDENERESSKSNSVSIQQTSDFSNDEVITINLAKRSTYLIEEKIKYVTVIGETMRGMIKISENRSSDLIIELKDVNMTSAEQFSCISTENNVFEAETLDFVVIFIIKGTNTLTGYSPSQSTYVPSANSEAKGEKGRDGICPVVLPTIIMIGDGSLTLKGGQGGDGGVGAPSTTWSTSVYGDGGDGGKGGDGLKCSLLYLAKETNLKTNAGKGGKGGSPGTNGSIISGPWNTSNWKNHYGKIGPDGSSYIGEQIIISGGERYAENYTTKIIIFWCVIGVVGLIIAVGIFNYIRIILKKKH